MSKGYPDAVRNFVKEHVERTTNRALAAMTNAEFDTNFTESSMKSYIGNNKLYRRTRGGYRKVFSKVFPEEVAKFIAENHAGTGHQQMANLIKDKLGLEYTSQQIKSYYKNHRLNSGLTGHFTKGHPPHNKGVKMKLEVYEKAKHTMFKPGHRPHNSNEVGDVTPTTDGYYKIKVAEPDVWEYCHIRSWQQAYGEIPDGMMVSFKDGQKENWNPENLMLLTKGENAVLNTRHLRSDQPEITETGVLVAKMYQAAKEGKSRKSKSKQILSSAPRL